MKILFVNDQYERGGAGRVAAILANQLYAKGYDIISVYDYQNWGHTYNVNDKIPRRLIITQSTKVGILDKTLKWWNCIKSIRRYIKEEKPDIIIATQAMMFFCCYIANMNIGIPIIAADHTSFTRRINPLLDFVRYRLYAKANGLSILTKKDFKVLGDKYPNKQVIYNPISFPILATPRIRKKRILCVGRLEVWDIKGFDLIIKIWAELAPKYPEWTLEIAGPGDSKSKAYLKKMIEDNKLSSCILLGQVDDMKNLYSSSEIFALPSRMEGFPMVLMEAMSQGCACIAFEVGGATNEMLDENSGIIVKDGDIEAFKQALITLIKDKTIRELYSINAINSVKKFSVDEFVDSWECLIHKTHNKNISVKNS